MSLLIFTFIELFRVWRLVPLARSKAGSQQAGSDYDYDLEAGADYKQGLEGGSNKTDTEGLPGEGLDESDDEVMVEAETPINATHKEIKFRKKSAENRFNAE